MSDNIYTIFISNKSENIKNQSKKYNYIIL